MYLTAAAESETAEIRLKVIFPLTNFHERLVLVMNVRICSYVVLRTKENQIFVCSQAVSKRLEFFFNDFEIFTLEFRQTIW